MHYYKSIEEIMQSSIASFQMLIKFGNKANLESFQRGTVYMKNIKNFNMLEQRDDSGKPDKNDGKWAVKDFSFTFFDSETNKPVFQGKAGSAVLSFGYEKYPIFCMFSFDYRNCGEYINDEENHMCTIPLSFTEEQKQKVKKGLGEYALAITNTNEFINRLKAALEKDHYTYRFDRVKYNPGNSIDRVQSVQRNFESIVFNKESDFAYQQEWRLFVTNKEVEDHLCVDIGDISDITVLVETDALVNNYKIKLTQHYYPV